MLDPFVKSNRFAVWSALVTFNPDSWVLEYFFRRAAQRIKLRSEDEMRIKSPGDIYEFAKIEPRDTRLLLPQLVKGRITMFLALLRPGKSVLLRKTSITTSQNDTPEGAMVDRLLGDRTVRNVV